MAARSILFAASRLDLRRRLLELLARSAEGFRTQAVDSLPDAVARIARQGFDAAVLAVDTPEDLTLALRVRNDRPELPLYLVLPDGDRDLCDRARESQAGIVVRVDRETGAGSELLLLALETRDISRSTSAGVARTSALGKEIGQLVQDNLRILDRRAPRRTFATLIVEDNPDHALLTVRSLTKAGFPDPIRVVTNGEEAISYLRGTGEFALRSRFPLPSLLLLDLHLPKKSGFEVLEWARQQDEFRDLPIVILTSSDEPADVDRARVLGATSYLVKPLDLHEFTAMAERLHKTWIATLP